MHSICSSKLRSTQRGVSLVELMVAITLGLMVLAALTTIFVNSSRARQELDRGASVIEEGRYALSILNAELGQAGYYSGISAVSGTTNAPCSVTVADWAGSLSLHAIGSNQGDTSFNCITRATGSDAIFIQRAGSCVAGPTAESGCTAMAANAAYIQVSECGAEYSGAPFVLAANTGTQTAVYPLKSIVLPTTTGASPTCSTTPGTAEIRKFYRSFYYVDSNAILWRMDVDAGSSANPPGTPIQIASGVENIQFEYGVDSSGDGAPDSFASAPTDWANVVGVRISVLQRSNSATPGYQDDKTYVLGDICSLPPGQSACPAPNSGNTPVVRTTGEQTFKRHVFTSYVTFDNPVGRRQQ